MPPPSGSKPPFGVDLDNVLALTDPLIRHLIEEMYGVRLLQADIKHFDYCRCGITNEQEKQVFARFHEGECARVAPVDEAIAALRTLAEDFEICIITGRPFDTKKLTLEWLSKNDVPYTSIDFLKQKWLSSVEFTAFVEDHRETAYLMASRGVMSFLMNYPWNQPNPADPARVERVNSWQEVIDSVDRWT